MNTHYTHQDQNWYYTDTDEVLGILQAKEKGLSTNEVERRTAHYGKNLLPRKRKVTLAAIIIRQFLSPLIYVLLIATIISFLLNEHSDAFFILLVLLVNAVIGTTQEWKAETSAEALHDMIRIGAKVMRANRIVQIDAEDLVPGDIVLLESGQKVPADVRLLEVNNLSIEEAILTGESVAVEKISEKIEETDTTLGDRFNMAFAGTMVASGRAKGVVVATGSNTEIGRLAENLQEMKTTKAPLVRRMERFSKRISIIVLVACMALGVGGYVSGIPINEIFFFVVAIAVSAIPEGLPISMTVALSIGTSRMAKRHVIIRKLTAVEGLGSCTMIATDKTGTLTVDQQTVSQLLFPSGQLFSVTGQGYNGKGEVKDEEGRPINYAEHQEVRELTEAVAICNESVLYKENGTWKHQGDAVDVALLALVYKCKQSPQEMSEAIEKAGEIPFESERKFAAVYYRQNGKLKIAVKGATEVILPKIKGNTSKLEEEATKLAARGYRVIAVAGNVTGQVEGEKLPELKLLGFVALIDPPRKEVKKAIDDCHRAGVHISMVTGDHPATALSIAKDLSIATAESQLITGKELGSEHAPDDPVFLDKIKGKRVFARVTPRQKQMIVAALQKLGHFVAVTGDGVNDAPALKTGDIGIAMGYGTDVAKDVSSVIITDNNFASIAAGIEEGRFTYANLRKIIYLLISTGAAELLMIGLSLAFSTPLPFLPVQILWLNLVTNGIQDKALAFEKGEQQLMHQPPRHPQEGIFNPLMIRQTLVAAGTIALLSFGLWMHLLYNLHWEEATARNTVLLLMVLLQNFHVFNCRSETLSVFSIPLHNNKLLIFGILAAQGIHVLAMQIPFMQQLLSLEPVNFSDWAKLLGTAALIIVAMEIFKGLYARKKPPSNIDATHHDVPVYQ